MGDKHNQVLLSQQIETENAVDIRATYLLNKTLNFIRKS